MSLIHPQHSIKILLYKEVHFSPPHDTFLFPSFPTYYLGSYRTRKWSHRLFIKLIHTRLCNIRNDKLYNFPKLEWKPHQHADRVRFELVLSSTNQWERLEKLVWETTGARYTFEAPFKAPKIQSITFNNVAF